MYLLATVSGSCLWSPCVDAVAARVSAPMTPLHCLNVQRILIVIFVSLLLQLK